MFRRLAYLAIIFPLILSACEDPAPEELIRRAENHRKDGDIAASIIELKNALQKEPKNARARFLLGESYLLSRNLVGAEKEFLRAREYGASLDELAAPLTEIWLTQQQFSRLLGELRAEDANLAASKATILVAQGMARRRIGNLDGAKRDFEAALEVEPENVMAFVGLARIAMEKADHSTAEDLIDRAHNKVPNDLTVLALKADYDFLRGDYAAAESQYQSILEVGRDDISVRMALARTQISLGKREQAITNLDLVLARARGHADANYLRASFALEAENYKIAKLHSQRALEISPKHVPSLLIAGVASYGLGELENADRYIGRVLAQHPKNQLARRLNAAIRARFERQDSSISLFGPLLDDSWEPRQLLTEFADATRQTGDLEAVQAFFLSLPDDYKDAILTSAPILGAGMTTEQNQLRSALKRSPRDVASLIALAQLENSAGHMQEAISLLERAVEAQSNDISARALLGQLHLANAQPRKTLDVIQVILRHNPQHPVLLALAGVAQLHAGEILQAKLTYRNLVDVQPMSTAALYLLALAYRDDGDPARFKGGLEQVLALDPDHLGARIDIARLTAEADDLIAAEGLAEEVLHNAPDDPEILDLAGVIALLRGRNDAAISFLERASRHGPSTMATLKLAYVLQKAGDGAKSRATLQTWLERAPADTEVRMVLANKYLAIDQLEQARAHYTKIILMSPNHIVALNNLAWVNMQLGNAEAALGYVERAQQLAPNDPRILDTFGLAQLRNGRVEEAVSTFRRARERSPDSPGVQVHLALALSEQDKNAEARKILHQVLSQETEFPEKQEAEALLNELGR